MTTKILVLSGLYKQNKRHVYRCVSLAFKTVQIGRKIEQREFEVTYKD